MKRILVGRPMATGQMEDTLLSKFLALPIFASDPLSSVAYATEAAMVVLVARIGRARCTSSCRSRSRSPRCSLIVALSYRQTVRAYETSGGAYVVAKDNLGTMPSLVAAAALLADYILTVAVSVAARGRRDHLGRAVAAPVPRVALARLRPPAHAREPARRPRVGTALRAADVRLRARAVRGARDGHRQVRRRNMPAGDVPHPVAAGTGAVTLFVLLRAFASGSAALTGVESISNGVSAFKRPQSKNAAQTLAIMAAIAITLFLGVSWLAVKMDARPSETASVLSQIAHASFPTGPMYYVVQGFTLAILILAANTSYQGFPRLAALLARDRFFPRQFVNLGDRLVFSNGIVLVAGARGALIVIFAANVDSLLHLYVVGVFTAFTLSQTGMVRYWRRTRDRGWQRRATVNAVGAMRDRPRDADRDRDEVHARARGR